MASLGQLRVAPSGTVMGLDLNAVHGIVAARGYAISVLSELLQAAEGVLVDKVNEKSDD